MDNFASNKELDQIILIMNLDITHFIMNIIVSHKGNLNY